MDVETNVDDIGIISETVHYPMKDYPGGDNLSFKIGDKYYYIDDVLSNKIDEINPTLKDDEILTDLVGRVYTYIIGTEINLDNFLSRDENNGTCNVNNMHIWAKKALSVQELASKHGSILYSSNEIFKKLNSMSLENRPTREELKTGVIDRIYYAGEFIIENDANDVKQIRINLLSGTYMLGKVDCKNVPLAVKNCILKFLKHKFGEINVYIDESGKTMITEQMSIELLNDYVNKGGVVVYEFDNAQQAKTFSGRKLALSKINSRIEILTNQIKTFENRFGKDKVSPTQIAMLENLQREKDELKKITANRYYSDESKEELRLRNVIGGRNKNKKSKKRKYNSHKKYQKKQKTRRKIKKNKNKK